MKIYKINKNTLKWKNITQINYKWNLPILVNHKREVIAGNSLYNVLPNEIYICVIEKNQTLEDTLFYVEEKIIEENSEVRFHTVYSEIKNYFKELKKPHLEKISLLDEIKETRCITEELYKMPPEDDYKGHGRIYDDVEEDIQMYLWEEATEEQKEKIKKNKLDEIEVDMDILKELL